MRIKWIVLTIIMILVFILVAPRGFFAPRISSSSEVTLEVQMFSGPEHRAMLPTVQYWNDRYAPSTGIRVQVTELGRAGYFGKLETQLAAGLSRPDIVHPFSLHLGSVSPYLEPLDEYLQRPDIMTAPDGEALSLEALLPKAMDMGRDLDGKTYMLPKDMSEVLLYYRKDLIPHPPETWPEFVALARKFTRSLNRRSPTQYGAAMPGKYEMWTFCSALPVLWPLGGEAFSPSMTRLGFDNSGAVEGLRVFEELAREGVLPPGCVDAEYPEIARLIVSGQVAMAIQWDAFYSEVLKDPMKYSQIYDKIDIAPPPGVRQKDGAVRRAMYVQTIGLGINRNSPHKEAAAKFLVWAALGEGARIYAENGGSSPVRKVWEDRPPYTQIMPWVDAFGKALAYHPDMTDMLMIGSSWIQQVMAGNATAQQAAQGLDEEIAEYLSRRRQGYLKK